MPYFLIVPGRRPTCATAAAHAALGLRRLQDPDARRLPGRLVGLARRRAECWPSPTSAGVASSAPTGTSRAGSSAKQNVFDDFIGVGRAPDRFRRRTTAGQLAIHGRSNGGLLVGAALTQRPDLFAAAAAGRRRAGPAALPPVHRSAPPGSPTTAIRTTRSSSRTRSPTRRCTTCEPGTAYPATLVLTGDHDDRVVPLHSHKFTATLQHAQARRRPDPDPGRDRRRSRDGQADQRWSRPSGPTCSPSPPSTPASSHLPDCGRRAVGFPRIYTGRPAPYPRNLLGKAPGNWVQRRGCSVRLVAAVDGRHSTHPSTRVGGPE